MIDASIIILLGFTLPYSFAIIIFLSDAPKEVKRDWLRAFFIAPFLFLLMYLLILILKAGA